MQMMSDSPPFAATLKQLELIFKFGWPLPQNPEKHLTELDAPRFPVR